MPGADLDIEYPLATEALSSAFPKIIAALEIIKTDLEAPVVPAEILVNAPFDFGGYGLEAGGYLTLEPVPDTDGYPAGTAMYDGSEWYLATSSGVVQITLGGGLNAGAIGGIVGDYGGVNPARVTYVDASSVYRFTEDTGNWADIEAEDLILHGSAAGSLTLTTTLTTNESVEVCDDTIPAAGNAVMVISDTGIIDTGLAVSNPLTISNADVILTGTSEIQHPDKRLALSFINAYASAAVSVINDAAPAVPVGLTMTAFGAFHLTLPLLPGDRIKSITIDHKGGAAGDDFVTNLYRFGAGEATLIVASPVTTSDIGTSWGSTTIDFTDYTVVTDFATVLMVTPTQTGISFGRCVVLYDHP